MEAILSRRSIRKYTDEPVPDEIIHELLRAAMAAPSAGNQQPWHFVVLNERRLLDQVPDVHPHAAMIREAPVAVLICADKTQVKHEGMWIQDCAAATENLLIAVQARGLGAVWLGVYPREDRVSGLHRLLQLPPHIVPFSLVPIGHPGEHKAPADRFRPELIHYNGW